MDVSTSILLCASTLVPKVPSSDGQTYLCPYSECVSLSLHEQAHSNSRSDHGRNVEGDDGFWIVVKPFDVGLWI